jgi:AraC-like DNA-binding protein
LESDLVHARPAALGPLADGCPGIIFQPPGAGTFYEAPSKQLPALFLYGQTLTRTEISLLGQFRTVGVCFFPHALKSLFGFDAAGLTDTCLDVGLLSAPLVERLLHTPDPGGQIEILAGWLSVLPGKTPLPVDAATRLALSRITGAGGQLSLPQLLRELKLSERSLERRFSQHVGLSPKLFARVCQFQAALSQLKNNRYARLSDVAYDNGYADQSHFIRTFRAFAGVAPYQWQKNAHPVTGDFPALIG